MYSSVNLTDADTRVANSDLSIDNFPHPSKFPPVPLLLLTQILFTLFYNSDICLTYNNFLRGQIWW